MCVYVCIWRLCFSFGFGCKGNWKSLLIDQGFVSFTSPLEKWGVDAKLFKEKSLCFCGCFRFWFRGDGRVMKMERGLVLLGVGEVLILFCFLDVLLCYVICFCLMLPSRWKLSPSFVALPLLAKGIRERERERNGGTIKSRKGREMKRARHSHSHSATDANPTQ